MGRKFSESRTDGGAIAWKIWGTRAHGMKKGLVWRNGKFEEKGNKRLEEKREMDLK